MNFKESKSFSTLKSQSRTINYTQRIGKKNREPKHSKNAQRALENRRKEEEEEVQVEVEKIGRHW